MDAGGTSLGSNESDANFPRPNIGKSIQSVRTGNLDQKRDIVIPKKFLEKGQQKISLIRGAPMTLSVFPSMPIPWTTIKMP